MGYCKKGYCISINQNSLASEATCKILSNDNIAKDNSTFCQTKGMPDMMECGPGYCLDLVNRSCILIKGTAYGKNLNNNFCIMDNTIG